MRAVRAISKYEHKDVRSTIMVRPMENSSILLTDGRLAAIALSIGASIGQYVPDQPCVCSARDAWIWDRSLVNDDDRLRGSQFTRDRDFICSIRCDNPQKTLTYDLDGTPCKSAYRGETVAISVDLARRFSDAGRTISTRCGWPNCLSDSD